MRIALVAFENEIAWGIRHIAEFLRSKGHKVSLYFLERYANVKRKMPSATIASFVNDFHPQKGDVVGISFMTPYLEDTRKLAKAVKKSGAFVVVGGIHPTIMPEECATFADFIIRGAGEESLLSLVEQLMKGKTPPKGVFPRDNAFWFTEDVTKFPYPRYGIIEDTVIVKGKIKKTSEVPRKVGPVVRYQTFTSFGCPYSCAYCVNPLLQRFSGKFGRKFVRRRKSSVVLAELRHVRDRIDTVMFEDEDFLTDYSWLVAFLKSYKKKINLPFSCLATPITLKGMDLDRVAEVLQKAKCVSISIGIQSASPRTSKLFHRYFNKENLISLARAFSKKGIMVTYDVITENPFEDEQDVSETVDTVLSLPHPFTVNMFYLTFFPRYVLTEEAHRRGISITMGGDTRVHKKKISMGEWIIQLAQIPFIPKKVLRYLYRKRSERWSRIMVSVFGRVLASTSPLKWLMMFRIFLKHPGFVFRPVARRFIS
ncbi:B12-binding domain-containing radical SAM protein [Candidatus Woesearchaeota archaeon]|nr:B12-binding domain-containing radical SAM protein [Candidatus Woesearchaeota archaeon]